MRVWHVWPAAHFPTVPVAAETSASLGHYGVVVCATLCLKFFFSPDQTGKHLICTSGAVSDGRWLGPITDHNQIASPPMLRF